MMNRKYTGGAGGGGGRGGRRMVLQLEETGSYLTKFGYHQGRSETTDQPSDSASDRPPPDEQTQYHSDEEEPDYNEEDFRGDDLTPERIPPPSPPHMANGGRVDIDDKVANFLAEIDALEPGAEDEEAPEGEAPPNENIHVELPMASFILNESQNKAALASEERPSEKSKSSKSGAYSMFVKGQSEFVHPSRQDDDAAAKKEKQFERWPEEPKTKWNQIMDENTQYYYYWHVDTNEVTWEIPPEYTQYLLKKKDYEEKVERLLKEGRLRPEDNPKHKHKGKSSAEKDKGDGSHDKSRHSEHADKHSESKETSHSKHKDSEERSEHSSSRKDKSPSRSSGTEDSDSSSSESEEEKNERKQKLTHYDLEASGDIDSVSSSTSGETKKSVLKNRLPEEGVEMNVPLSEIELPDSTDKEVKPKKVDKEKRRGSAESQGSDVGKGTKPDSAKEKRADGGSAEAREEEEDFDIEDIDRELEMALEKKKAELLSLQANEKKKSTSEEKEKEKERKDDREKDKRKEKDHHHHHHRRKEDDRRKERERSRERDRDRRKEDDRKKRDSRDDRYGRKDKDSKSSSSKDSGKKDQKREPEKILKQSTLLDSVRKEVEMKKISEARKKKAIEELMAKELEEVAAKHGRKRHARDDDRDEGRKRLRDEGPESNYRRGHDDFDDGRRWSSRDEEDYRDRLERAYDRWDRPLPPPLPHDDPLYELERRERLHKPPPPTEEMVAYEVVDYGHRRGRPYEQDGDSDPETRRSHEESIREKEVKKLEALQLAELSLSKLEFLEVTKKGLSKLQILLIELETRHQDWQSGGLTTEHFLSKLREANWQLQQYEDSAAPPGWSCHWDRAYRRYFYVNNKTSATQWDYPTDLEEHAVEDDSSVDYTGDAGAVAEGEMVSSTTISTSRSSADSTLMGRKMAPSGTKPIMKRATKEMLAGVAHLPPPPPPPAEEHPIVKGLQLMYGSSSESEEEEEKKAPAPPPPKKKEESPPPKKKEKSPPPKKRDRTPPPKKRDRTPPPKKRDRTPPPKKRDRTPPPKKRDRTPPPKKKKKEKKEKRHKTAHTEIGPQLPVGLPPEPSKSITPPPPTVSGVPESVEPVPSVPASAPGGETFYGAMPPPPPPPPAEPVSVPPAGSEPVQGPTLPAPSEPPHGTLAGPPMGAGDSMEVSEDMDGVEFPEAQPVDQTGDTSTHAEGTFAPYPYAQQEEETGDVDSEHLYDVSEPSIHARPPEIAAVAAPAYYPPTSVPPSSYVDPQGQVQIGPVVPEPSSSVDGIPLGPPTDGHAGPPPAGQAEDREKKKKKKDKSISSSIALKKRHVSSLVQKWQKVKKEVELEERNREERDAEIRRKLEEWKQEQPS